MQKNLLLASLVLLAGLLLAGCSEHQNSVPSALGNNPTGVRGKGSISCSVKWPQPTKGTRVIPDSTATINVTVTQGSTVVGSASLVRQPGATSAMCEIDNLPAGAVNVLASALDSSNKALATSGWLTATIQDQVVTPLGVNLVACPSKRLLVNGFWQDSSGQHGSLYALSLADGSLTQLNSHTDISNVCCVNNAGTRVAFDACYPYSSVYTMNLDGSQQVLINATAGGLAFSPDGWKLAVGNGQIIDSVNSFGGPLTPIANPYAQQQNNPANLAYSPDGSTIAFDNWTGLIGAVNVNTGQYTQLINATDGTLYAEPTYSPDGNKIAFCVPGSDWASGAIDTINATGGNLTTVTSSSSRLLWQPIYSPDGSEIVYSSIIQGSSPVYSLTMADVATGTHSVELTLDSPQNLQFMAIGWIQ